MIERQRCPKLKRIIVGLMTQHKEAAPKTTLTSF